MDESERHWRAFWIAEVFGVAAFCWLHVRDQPTNAWSKQAMEEFGGYQEEFWTELAFSQLVAGVVGALVLGWQHRNDAGSTWHESVAAAAPAPVPIHGKPNHFLTAVVVLGTLYLQLQGKPGLLISLGRPLAKGLEGTQAGKTATKRLDELDRGRAEAMLADPDADRVDLMGGTRYARANGISSIVQVRGAIDEVAAYGDARAAAALGRAVNRFGRAPLGAKELEIDALSKLPFEESYRALAQAASDPFPSSLAGKAAGALGKLGRPAAAVALQPMVAALRRLDSPSAMHSQDCTGTAWAFGAAIAGMGGIDELAELLRKGGRWARQGACEGLGLSGDPRAFDFLLAALPFNIDWARDYESHRWIATALGRLDVDRLTKLALDERYDSYTRQAFVSGLETSPIPWKAKASLKIVAEKTKDPAVREEAAKLRWIPD